MFWIFHTCVPRIFPPQLIGRRIGSKCICCGFPWSHNPHYIRNTCSLFPYELWINQIKRRRIKHSCNYSHLFFNIKYHRVNIRRLFSFLCTRNSDGLRPSSFSLLRRAGRALRALLGTSGPILSSSIQKYTYNICRSK